MIYDYIVIGGGLSGLNTCYQIKKKNVNKKILLIEKDNYLGGRIQSIYLPNNNHYETGGIRFYPTHKNLLKLLDNFGYKKKDFITIKNKNLVKDIIYDNKNKDNLNYKEEELNTILLENKKNYKNDYLLKITFETYARQILGNEKLNYLKTINGFHHIFPYTSALYGLKLLKRDFIDIKEFYLLKEPLSDFVYKIVDYLTSKKCVIKLNEEFLNYKKEDSKYIIETKKNKYI